MLKTRIITAIIGILLLFLFLFYFTYLIPLLIIFCAGICAYELAKMLLVKNVSFNQSPLTSYIDIICIISLSCVPLVVYFWLNKSSYFLMTCIIVLLSFLLSFLSSKDVKRIVNKIFIYLTIILYITIPWICVYELYLLDIKSLKYIFLLLAIVWGADIGAYFVGVYLGKHKIFPTISPNKTIEGVGGAFVGGVCFALLVYNIFNFKEFLLTYILIISIIGIFFSIIGDAIESCFKRFAGVKDSGKIFPGHGGLLDRVDSILLTATALFIMLNLFNMSQ